MILCHAFIISEYGSTGESFAGVQWGWDEPILLKTHIPLHMNTCMHTRVCFWTLAKTLYLMPQPPFTQTYLNPPVYPLPVLESTGFSVW